MSTKDPFGAKTTLDTPLGTLAAHHLGALEKAGVHTVKSPAELGQGVQAATGW